MTATRHATLPIAAAILATCAIAPSAAATSSVIVTPTHATETVDGIARAFTGEQASATTIDWLQATLTVPATTIGSTSAWVMASASAPNPYGATWSQVGWVANGYTPRLFTQTYNGTTVTTTYYGTLPPTVTVAESCNFGTGVFTTWLWYGGWLALSSSQPGQSCGNQLVTWSVEVEMDGSAPGVAAPPAPKVTLTHVVVDALGFEVAWPSRSVGQQA